MIDRQTVEKIKEAANIVDVVSEFVTLKRSGANYKGLCPFHNEKTPSFYVSPARGTCHCFGCGKGGNAVSFIMEHEQMTYPEALRWLANKYHIEIHERELTNKEKEEQSQRESMFIVNEWAAKYFEDLLHNHADGVAVGMQYFRSRGFRFLFCFRGRSFCFLLCFRGGLFTLLCFLGRFCALFLSRRRFRFLRCHFRRTVPCHLARLAVCLSLQFLP